MADGNPLAGLYPQPNQGGVGGMNPLQLIGTIGQINNNALFQKEFAAKQAVGGAFQNALNPDGSIDQAKLSTGLQNPAAAYAAPEAIGSMLQQRGQSIANNRAQFELGASQNAATMNILGPLINDPNPTYAKLQNLAPTLARIGVPANMINGYLQGAPRDPAALKAYLANVNNMAMGPAASSGRVEGPPTAEGAPTQIGLGQAVHLGAGGAPAAAPAAPLGITTGMSPGQNEAQKNVGSSSGAQLAGDLANSNNFRRSVYPLEQAIPALERLGTAGSGPGSDTFNNVKSFIQTLGIPGVDAGKIKDYDEASKYLTDFVNQTGNSGTNDKLAAAFAGNPSTKISNAAAVDVAKSALSLRRMQQGQVTEWQNANLPDDQYSKWASKWQTQQDPRAYGFDLMSADAQQKLVSSLKGADRTKFIASLQAADRSGVVNRPQGQ